MYMDSGVIEMMYTIMAPIITITASRMWGVSIYPPPKMKKGLRI
jgi:hypothetical protein